MVLLGMALSVVEVRKVFVATAVAVAASEVAVEEFAGDGASVVGCGREPESEV
jgi:hypothetical protein